MASPKHKKHKKYVDNLDTEKRKNLERIADRMVKQIENGEKLKQYKISKDFLKDL